MARGKHPGAVLLGSRGGRPPKSAAQSMARAQPRTPKATGVVPHSNRPYVKRVDKPIQPDKGTFFRSTSNLVRKKIPTGQSKPIQPTNQKTNQYGTSN